MLTYLQMIIAFLIISGVALFFVSILKLDIAEGFVLSAASLILIIYGFGWFLHSLLVGRLVFFFLSVTGFLLVFLKIRRGEIERLSINRIYIGVIAAVFFLCIFLCNKDYIRHIDEFHMWALAPKYMLQYHRLPSASDFVGSMEHQIGTCIFNYYFQTFTGYHEGMMYCSSLFLSWIGILLPLGSKRNCNWKSIILYVTIVYFSVASLYIHGTKSCYVDLPTCAWLGGIAAWCINREKKRQNAIVIATVILAAYLFKGWAGLLFGIFFLALFFFRKLVFERKRLKEESYRVEVIIVGLLTLLTSVAGIILVAVFRTVDLQTIFSDTKLARIAPYGYSLEKADKTITSILLNITGKPLNFIEFQMRITLLEAIVICLVILMIYGFINDRVQEAVIYGFYSIIISISYLCVLLVGHVFRMSYTFAVSFWAGHRYVSILAIYLFLFSLSLLLFDRGETPKQNRYAQYVGLTILLFFVYGVRTNFLSYYTPVDNTSIGGYDTITEQKEESDLIKDIIGKKDKVYFLNQDGAMNNELETNPALYYMGKQISDYRVDPWQYHADGGVINISSFSNYKLAGFPGLLSSGKYTYVWIYKTDDFLNSILPGVISISAQDETDEYDVSILDGQLFKVIYDNEGNATELKLIKNLKPYDERLDI